MSNKEASEKKAAGAAKKRSRLTEMATNIRVLNDSGQAILRLNVEDVVSRVQSRKKFRRIQQLAQAIQENGQLQPIVVSPRNADGKYVIKHGERRWRACRRLSIPVEAVIKNTYEPEDRALGSELVENIQREDLEPLEIAAALDQMQRLGRTHDEIAKFLGKSRNWVTNHLSLNKLSDAVREALTIPESDGVDPDEAGELLTYDVDTLNSLRQLDELAPEWLQELLSDAMELGSLSRTDARRWVKAAKEAKEQGLDPKAYFEAVASGAASERAETPEYERPGKGVGVGTLLDQGSMDTTTTNPPGGGDGSGTSGGVFGTSSAPRAPASPGQSAGGLGDLDSGEWEDEEEGDAGSPFGNGWDAEEGQGPGHHDHPSTQQPKADGKKPKDSKKPSPSESAAPLVTQGPGWTEFPAAPFRILVMHPIEGADGAGELMAMGELMAHRIDDNPEFAWVLPTGEEGGEPLRVPTDEITLMAVEART